LDVWRRWAIFGSDLTFELAVWGVTLAEMISLTIGPVSEWTGRSNDRRCVSGDWQELAELRHTMLPHRTAPHRTAPHREPAASERRISTRGGLSKFQNIDRLNPQPEADLRRTVSLKG
jgi:hypothetical protein